MITALAGRWLASLIAALSGAGASLAAQETPRLPSIPEEIERRVVADYPGWAIRNEEQGAYFIAISVKPDGKAYDCRIVWSMGSEKLGKHLCSSFLRTRLSPARSADGAMAYGVTRGFHRFMLGNSKLGKEIDRAGMRPDIVLEVAELPNRRSKHLVSLVLSMSSDGAVDSCTPVGVVDEGLVEAACQYAGVLDWPKALSEDGEPVPVIRPASVLFEVAAGN